MESILTTAAFLAALAIIFYIAASTFKVFTDASQGRVNQVHEVSADLIDTLFRDNDRIREDNLQKEITIDRLRDERDKCYDSLRKAPTIEIERPEVLIARMMDNHLSLPEIKTILFDYDGSDWDNLRGDTKREKINSLVTESLRENRLLELLNLARGAAPRIDWPEV